MDTLLLNAAVAVVFLGALAICIIDARDDYGHANRISFRKKHRYQGSARRKRHPRSSVRKTYGR